MIGKIPPADKLRKKTPIWELNDYENKKLNKYVNMILPIPYRNNNVQKALIFSVFVVNGSISTRKTIPIPNPIITT